MVVRWRFPLLIGTTLGGLLGCSSGSATPQDAGADLALDRPADAGTPDGTALPDATPLPDVPRDAVDAADAGGGCAPTRVVVATSDFRTGGYATGPLGPMPSMLSVVRTTAPDQDHVLVQSGCVLFELLRGNDEVRILEGPGMASRSIPLRGPAADGGTDAGAGGMNLVNPQDALLVTATRAYVTQLAAGRIAIIDPGRNGAAALTGGIDLGPLVVPMDRDGSPEATTLVRSGDRAYATLQNLTAFAPVANGAIAVIDTTTDRLVDADPAMAGTQAVVLSGRNPSAMVGAGPNRLVVAEAGVLAFQPPQALDGGIETVDLATLRPSGFRVTEMQLGGDVTGLVMHDGNRGWALVTRLASDAGPGGDRVVEFDLAAGTVGRTVLTAGSLVAMARDPSGNVWVLDRSSMRAGVRVLRPDGTELTTTPLATGLPPYSIAFAP